MFLVFVMSLIFTQSVNSSHLLPEISPIPRTYPCNPDSQCIEQDHGSIFYCINIGNGYKWYDIKNIWAGNPLTGGKCNLNNFNTCSTFNLANSCVGVVDPVTGYKFESGRLSGFCNPQTIKWNFYDEADFNNLCIPKVTRLQSCNQNSECAIKQGNELFYCINFNNAGFKLYEVHDFWRGDLLAGTATCNLQNFNTCSTFTLANACVGKVDPLSPNKDVFKSGRLSGFCNPQTIKWNFYDEASFTRCVMPVSATATAQPSQIPPVQPPAIPSQVTPSPTVTPSQIISSGKNIIKRFSIPTFFSFDEGDYSAVYAKIKNTGNKKSNIKIILTIPELGLYEIRNIELNSKQAKWSIFRLDLPQGEYIAMLEVSNEKGSHTRYLEIENR